MTQLQRTISPVDGRVYVERELMGVGEVDAALARAVTAFPGWRATPHQERARILGRALEIVESKTDLLADELTMQMGRPRSQTPGEIAGFLFRGRTMLRLGETALADLVPPAAAGFVRHIERVPVGPVLVLSPWNYPWLCAVNAVWPALLAGNPVILKHSDQTPLVAERIVEALGEAGCPGGVVQFLHLTNEVTAVAVADPRVARVVFTGSVEGGRAVHRAAGGTFKPVMLELGGKDPAYVRADADLERSVLGIVDGALFNSGQSCCAVERVYVHRSLFDAFVDRFVREVHGYVLGDPREPKTNLGPMVRARNADVVRTHIREAVRDGAKALVDPAVFPAARDEGPYLAPQVLVDVTDRMAVMREETFGPVVGILAVADDDEAVTRMNDSRYGLTASIWTRDVEAAQALGQRIDTGTVFMNRCDYLDPELAWVGVKDSGVGCSLSELGFAAFVRPKSFHLRL